MRGHTRAVRALQFDEVKLITGSMDHSIKVWDWRRGQCIRTLNGHTDGVVCLNFDSNVLASGGVDSTVKVWNLRTGTAFTLRGHSDWVNAVQLWDSNGPSSSTGGASIFDVSGSTSPIGNNQSSQIDPGKMLFSASDDGTIKLWDLNLRTCVRQFTGHVGQVQSMKLLMADECDDEASGEPEVPAEPPAAEGEPVATVESHNCLSPSAKNQCSSRVVWTTRSSSGTSTRAKQRGRTLGISRAYGASQAIRCGWSVAAMTARSRHVFFFDPREFTI